MPAALAALLALLAGPARAGDTWSDPATGVRYLHRTTSQPEDIHVAQVDLCERGVTVRATRESERQDQVSDWAEAAGVDVAVNADFFSYDDYYPIGLAVGNGTAWHADNTTEANLAFGPQHANILPEADNWTTPDWWMDEVVSGYPRVVVDGAVPTSFARSDCTARHPRTIAGLSEDRRTLWLVAVDGRASDSDGMTCEELGELMVDLGAYTAVNLDGGGSTTLWFDRYGVVNTPSDGSERVVANHLGVVADGSGAPGSCDFWLDEPEDDAAILDAPSTTDVDGDGLPDACARASAGLRCYPPAGRVDLDALSNAEGFDDPANYSTIRFGDVNGDGRADVCARRDDGFACWPSTGAAFGDRWDLGDMSDAQGWGEPGYYTTIRLADVDGDGRDDVCGRSAAGVRCWPSTGSGFGAAVTGPTLADSSGWNHPYYYGTLRVGDLDGDGRMDLCARGGAKVYCYRSTGAAWEAVDGPAWSNDAGWDDVMYWSTIRFQDVDGDRRDDLVGRDADGVWVARSNGAGFDAPVLGKALSDESGWWDHSNYATIRLGDVDADGDLDLCARANAGLYCWLWDGAAWTDRIDGPAHADDSGWSDWRYYLTLRVADIDGDGAAELCDRSSAGFSCYRFTEGGYDTIAGPTWSDDSGWASAKYLTTIRLAGRRARGGGSDSGDSGSDSGADSGSDSGDGGADSGDGQADVVRDGGECGCGGDASAAVLLLGLAAARRRAPRRKR